MDMNQPVPANPIDHNLTGLIGKPIDRTDGINMPLAVVKFVSKGHAPRKLRKGNNRAVVGPVAKHATQCWQRKRLIGLGGNARRHGADS